MTSHVRRYHKHYRTSGHVWQGRFKSFIVQDDTHLLTVARYIKANPVRWGLVATTADWQWSSHWTRTGQAGGFEKELPLPLPPEWTRYVDTPMSDAELEKLRRSVNRQTPYGLAGWQGRMVRSLGLAATLKPRGRPRKKSDPEK
jgi:putative transposase